MVEPEAALAGSAPAAMSLLGSGEAAAVEDPAVSVEHNHSDTQPNSDHQDMAMSEDEAMPMNGAVSMKDHSDHGDHNDHRSHGGMGMGMGMGGMDMSGHADHAACENPTAAELSEGAQLVEAVTASLDQLPTWPVSQSAPASLEGGFTNIGGRQEGLPYLHYIMLHVTKIILAVLLTTVLRSA